MIRHVPDRKCLGAFTLLEMLVATTVLVLMLTILLSIVTNVSQHWQRAEGMKTRQQAARQILETISRDLESAVFPIPATNDLSFQFLVNPADQPTLVPYENPQAAFWQAAAGSGTSQGDIVEVGYFICWAASGVHSEIRRLRVPSNQADIFSSPKPWLSAEKLEADAPGTDDIVSQKGLLAENVIGLWIQPYNRQGIAISPPYDSRVDRTVPSRRIASVEVALALIDPRTLKRVTDKNEITQHYLTDPPPDADTFVTLLPAKIRAGVQVFKTRVNIEAAPQ
jgi:type II secretory pathway pseudopilin PulG